MLKKKKVSWFSAERDAHHIVANEEVKRDRTYVDGVFPGLQRFCDSQHVHVRPVLPILVLL